MAKRYNPNLAKIHYSYSVAEIAALFGVFKGTVRAWLNDGLRSIDGLRPICVQGQQLREYIKAKNASLKRPCALHELYCLRCRQPRTPYGDMVEFIPLSNSTGRLIALCSVCETPLNKITSVKALSELCLKLEVTVRES